MRPRERDRPGFVRMKDHTQRHTHGKGRECLKRVQVRRVRSLSPAFESRLLCARVLVVIAFPLFGHGHRKWYFDAVDGEEIDGQGQKGQVHGGKCSLPKPCAPNMLQ